MVDDVLFDLVRVCVFVCARVCVCGWWVVGMGS